MAGTRRVRTTDAKARVTLPKSFANATVIVEAISDTELRICKAEVIPEDQVVFAEECRKPLSDRDRDLFLKMLENPPEPNEALKKAIAEYKANKGRIFG